MLWFPFLFYLAQAQMVPQHHAPAHFKQRLSPQVQPSDATIEKRIFYGTKVDLGAVPFIVSLINQYNDASYTLCGGSILNPYWVVTAAHCLESGDQLCPGCGASNHLTTKNTITITAGDSVLLTHDATQQKMYPKQMFVHSDYSSATLAHDIALIRLGSPIVFNNNVSNVTLSTELPPYNTTLSVAGWGATEHGNHGGAPELRKINYGFPNTSVCKARYEHYLLDSMWCSGDIDMHRRAGVGDSGGPVYHSNGSTFYLDGLVSWSVVGPIGYADYDVNTHIPFLNTWIEETQANYTEPVPLVAADSSASYTWNNSAIRYTHHPIYITCNHTASCQIKVTVVSHDFSLDKGSSLTVHSGPSPRSPVLSVIHHESVGTLQYISSTPEMLLEVLTGEHDALVSLTINYMSVYNVSGTQGQCGVFNTHLNNGEANFYTECDSGVECYDELNDRCDEYNDCSDYSDELHCRYSGDPASDTAIGCYNGDFKCGNKWCIRGKFACDGYTDCIDGSDESELTCSVTQGVTAWTVALAMGALAAVVVLIYVTIRMGRPVQRRSQINVSSI